MTQLPVSPAPEVQVWSPPGFSGLELEVLNHVPSFGQQVYHTGYEINVLLRGEGRVRYHRDHWTGRVDGPQPLVFVEGVDEVSTVTVTNPILVTMRNLRVSPPLMRALLDDGHDQPSGPAFPRLLSEVPAVNRRLARLAARVFAVFSMPHGQLARESALMEMIRSTAHHLAETAPQDTALRQEHQAVRLVKNHLRERLEEDTSLGELAALTRLNRFHLLAVFRRDVGVSPHVFQRFVRLQEAKRLLIAGLPLADLAARCGFADQSHFNRVFKRHTQGLTPGQYRRDSVNGTPTMFYTGGDLLL